MIGNYIQYQMPTSKLIMAANIVVILTFLPVVFCYLSDHINKTSSKSIDFIFGFSNGHVGTKGMSDRQSYEITDKVQFIFEGRNIKIGSKFWSENSSFQYEKEFVRQIYIPSMIKYRENKTVLIDLGHHNIFFIDALISHLLYETSYRFILVRIRRNRYETANSLMYKDKKHIYGHISQLKYRYYPFDRTEQVILKVNFETWQKFGIFQQALWFIDETEAQWQRIIQTYPTIEFINIMWSQEDQSSFDKAIQKIGTLLGLSPRSKRGIQSKEDFKHERLTKNSHSNLHLASKFIPAATKSKRVDIEKSIIRKYEKLDKQYKQLMTSSAMQWNLSHYIY
jgi:hypothetical protein